MCCCGTQKGNSKEKFVYLKPKKKRPPRPQISWGCQEKQ